MPGRNAQVARIYTILNLLEGAPQGLTVPEIESRVTERGHEASRRTIYRDLEALNAAGFPLFPSGGDADNAATRWVLEKTTTINKSLVLSTRELVALYLAQGMLIPLKDTPFYEDLQSIFKKIDEKLGSKSREYLSELASEIRFEPAPRWGLGLDPDLLETIRAACAERQCLEVQYQSASSGRKDQRRLGPHFLYFAKGSLYLVAEDLKEAKVKVFSCPRINQARMLDLPYAADPIDPEEYFKDSFGIFRGEKPIGISIEFSNTIAPYIKERRWHQSQRIVTKANGSIHLQLETSITPELIQWVLGFGAHARVLEPQGLREQIISSAAELLSLYQGRKAA